MSRNHDNTLNSVEPSVTLTVADFNHGANHATWISATVLSVSGSFPSMCQKSVLLQHIKNMLTPLDLPGYRGTDKNICMGYQFP